MISLLKHNIKSYNAKRRRQREQWKKKTTTTTIGLISKKATLHVQHTFFFCTFLYRCFARLLRETARNFLVTRFMEGMSDVFFFTLFSLSLIFTLVAASIPPLKNFILFLKQKTSPFIFFSLALAPFLVELRWPVALHSLFLCLSFLSIFQTCGHDN